MEKEKPGPNPERLKNKLFDRVRPFIEKVKSGLDWISEEFWRVRFTLGTFFGLSTITLLAFSHSPRFPGALIFPLSSAALISGGVLGINYLWRMKRNLPMID